MPVYIGTRKALLTPKEGVGVSIFDLVVNGRPLVVNTKQLRVTSNGN